jgi:hypothetical protein
MCLEYLTYGASQSNWLANIDIGDILFLSQFNNKSQNLFGPFRVNRGLSYNKDIIYPQQKYFYRIQFEPIEETKIIEETDLYLHGIQSENLASFVRIINLIQQNKHLHCISLTVDEGKAIIETFQRFGHNYGKDLQKTKLKNELEIINCGYLWTKNRLNNRNYFSSESDLEAYLLFSLKNPESREYNSISRLLDKYEHNDLQISEVYNQFVFGNAYPSDMAILNRSNINVFELKKGKFTQSMFQQIEKEITKHLYYSIFSERIRSIISEERFNFYLICLKDEDNLNFKRFITKRYDDLCGRMKSTRENTFTFIEYSVEDNQVLFEEM